MPKKKQLPAQHQKKQPGIEATTRPQPVYCSPHYNGSGKLSGKIALVTGGDSGIGRAVAYHFALEGAHVIVHYLNEHGDAQKTQELIKAQGKSCWLISGRLDTYKSCQSMISKALKCSPNIHILVNNIAEQHPQNSLEDISCEQFEKTFKTNVFSYFFVTKLLLPHLKKGSVIINTASVTAYKGSDHLVDYSATKGAIIALTRSLSQNLIKEDIRVNAVAPGPIWTPLIPASLTAKEVKEFGKLVPMKRIGQPSEIAPAYVYLASDDSSYMTGQVLHPNGGVIVNG